MMTFTEFNGMTKEDLMSLSWEELEILEDKYKEYQERCKE